MLSMYRERYDGARSLVGADLSPRMVELATVRLGSSSKVLAGDMCNLLFTGDGSAASHGMWSNPLMKWKWMRSILKQVRCADPTNHSTRRGIAARVSSTLGCKT